MVIQMVIFTFFIYYSFYISSFFRRKAGIRKGRFRLRVEVKSFVFQASSIRKKVRNLFEAIQQESVCTQVIFYFVVRHFVFSGGKSQKAADTRYFVSPGRLQLARCFKLPVLCQRRLYHFIQAVLFNVFDIVGRPPLYACTQQHFEQIWARGHGAAHSVFYFRILVNDYIFFSAAEYR